MPQVQAHRDGQAIWESVSCLWEFVAQTWEALKCNYILCQVEIQQSVN